MKNVCPPGLISIPPLDVMVPEPPIVPAVSVIKPLTVRSPAPDSVPPVIVSVLWIEELAAIEIVPPERAIGWLEVRLWTESTALVECLTFAAMLIVTSSAAAGILPVLQLPGVSQLLSPAWPVHDTADR